MSKKHYLLATVSITVVALFLIASALEAKAAKQVPPLNYKLERKYDQSDTQIKDMLKQGWSLGGVYRECGEGFGEFEVSADVSAALAPLYEKAAEKARQEILALLKKTNTPSRSQDILEKIVAGQDRLTNYGSLPEYQNLQDRYDKINSILADLKAAPKTGSASAQSLVEKLEAFIASGSKTDVNPAMRAAQSLTESVQKNPELVMDPGKSGEENFAALERVRKALQDSLSVAQKMGGGCRMVYLYYRVGQ